MLMGIGNPREASAMEKMAIDYRGRDRADFPSVQAGKCERDVLTLPSRGERGGGHRGIPEEPGRSRCP